MPQNPSDTKRRVRDPSLVEDLDDVADDLLELQADFGVHHARVFVVVYAWSGGEPFKGRTSESRRVELTPRPRVQGEDSLRTQLTGAGVTERGTIRLDRISPRYTEADLDTIFTTRAPAEEVVIEVIHDGRDGNSPKVRAYKPAGRPMRDVERFQWTVAITKVEDDRHPRRWAGVTPGP